MTAVGEFEEILRRCERVTGTEVVATAHASGRIPAADIVAPGDLPEFRRSTVDGFAVISSDTHGASESIPLYLDMAGDIPVGTKAERPLKSGEAARVVTGGMIPDGSDAVVMLEYADIIDERTLEVRRAAARLENLALVGEDVARGGVVVPAARSLGPFDIGALMGLGILEIEVFKKPSVTVFSTGTEVVEPTEMPPPGKVRDINKYAVAAGVSQAGGISILLPTVADDLELLTGAIRHGAQSSDVVILSGGSSVGGMDFTADAINNNGPPGVLVHGLAVKPGKPTIFGMAGDVPVIGLPGHPAGALVIFTIFIAPLIRRIGGNRDARPFTRSISAQITRSVAGSPGRHVYLPTALEFGPPDLPPRAVPILGKSGAVSILTKSDGIIVIDPMREGIEAGTIVDVYLHRRP